MRRLLGYVYSTPLVVIGLVCCLLKPNILHAALDDDARCDTLTQSVSTAYKRLKRTGETQENLTFIASAARLARVCYGDTRTQRRIWLLHKEVWSLDNMERYREVEVLVDLFYRSLYEDATEEYRARLALDRLRLRARNGDLIGAMVAYEEARIYGHALPEEEQVHMQLDGAYLYFEGGLFDQSTAIAQKALRNKAIAGSLVHARAHLMYYQSRLEKALQQTPADVQELTYIIDGLKATGITYLNLGEPDQYAEMLAKMGRAYTALGKDSLATAHFEQALSITREEEDVEMEIYVLLNRGRAYLARQALPEAKADFTEALKLHETGDKWPYTAYLFVGLGQVFEAQGLLHEAEQQFRQVLASSRGTHSAAKQEARERLFHVLLAQQHRTKSRWLLAFWLIVPLLLGAVGYGLWQRRRLQHVQADHRQQNRFALPAQPLSVRRLTYMKEVFDHPQEVAALIVDEEPRLARRLCNKGLPRNRTDLYLCVAGIEQAVEGHDHSNPGDTVRMDLLRYFKKMHWTWPRSLEEWHGHLKQYPPDSLMKKEVP